MKRRGKALRRRYSHTRGARVGGSPITAKETAALLAILECFHKDRVTRFGDGVRVWRLTAGENIIASLIAKGLAWQTDKGREARVGLTREGFDAIPTEDETPGNAHPDDWEEAR